MLSPGCIRDGQPFALAGLNAMILIANTDLYNRLEYGRVSAGERFEVSEDTGRELLRNGLARKPGPPVIMYKTKVITPHAPEVAAREPFHDVPTADEEPSALATLRDAVRADAVLHASRDPRGFERRQRGRSGRR